MWRCDSPASVMWADMAEGIPIASMDGVLALSYQLCHHRKFLTLPCLCFLGCKTRTKPTSAIPLVWAVSKLRVCQELGKVQNPYQLALLLFEQGERLCDLGDEDRETDVAETSPLTMGLLWKAQSWAWKSFL